MSGETEREESGWTTDTLRYYFQKQIDDLASKLEERYQTQTKAVDAAFAAAERAVQSALLAAEKAVGKAETAAEKRFESVNEFRGQLNDIVTTLISRAEAEARLTSISEKVDALDKRLDLNQGRSTGLDKGWSYLVALAGVAVAIAALIIR